MILFISAWHLGVVFGVVGFVLALAAFMGVAAVLQLLWGIADEIEQEKSGAEQQKRDRRSAGAKQGWATRKANQSVPTPDAWKHMATPDDAFVQRGEDQ